MPRLSHVWRERFLIITLPAVENKRSGAAECTANCPAAPPGVYTAAAHACCCRTAIIGAAHAMLPVTGLLVEGKGPGDGCSRAARDFFGMSCVLEKLCPTPDLKILYVYWQATAVTSRLSLWVFQEIFMFVVRANFVGRGQKEIFDWKFVPRKIVQLISRHLVQKTRYEAGICQVKLPSKARNTGFSCHIQTGCHLPVCITIYLIGFLPIFCRKKKIIVLGC